MWNQRFFLGVAAMGVAQKPIVAADRSEKDIVTTAVEAGSFRTFAAVLNFVLWKMNS